MDSSDMDEWEQIYEKKGGGPDREKDSTEISHKEKHFSTITKSSKVSFFVLYLKNKSGLLNSSNHLIFEAM